MPQAICNPYRFHLLDTNSSISLLIPITPIKECGEAYFTWHKKEADAKANLTAIKKAIKENDAVAWFKHGISVERDKTNNNFDKDEAQEVITELCEKLNYSKKKTAKFIGRCTKKTKPFTTISKAV